jgi:nucleoside-diphosphate-sugar epimerase
MLSGKRILVTGATGMMGRALAEHLAGQNQVWAVARFSDPALRPRFERQGIRCLPLDLARGDLTDLPRDADLLLHFAVWWGGPAPAAIEFNGQLVARLLEALPNLQSFVLGSTVAVYTGSGVRDNLTEESATIPGGIYGTSKLIGEQLAIRHARRHGLPGSILRYWFPYTDEPGVPQNYYEGLLRQVVEGRTFTLPAGTPGCQQPVFISDLVRITLDSLRLAAAEPLVLNVAGAERLTLAQVLGTLGEVTGVAPKIVLDASGKSDLLSGSYTLDRLAQTCGLGTVTFREGIARLHERWRQGA